MSLKVVPLDSGNERQHRTVISTALNECIKVRPPNDRTAGEVFNGNFPLDYSYPPGDARRWGVVGASNINDMNSIGDQTKRLQAAIDATQKESTNAELLLPAGYILSGPVTITKGCKIRGTKGTNNYVGTTLWYNGDATSDFVKFDASIGTGPCGFEQVYLYIDTGVATTGAALKYVSAGGTQRPSEFIIREVLIDPGGTFGRGLYIDGSASTTAGSTGIRDIRIDKLRVTGCSVAGESVLLNWVTHLTATMLHVNQGGGSAAGVKITGTNFNINLTALECEGALDIGGTTDRVTLGGFVTGNVSVGASVTNVAGLLPIGGTLGITAGATGLLLVRAVGTVTNGSDVFHIMDADDPSGQLAIINRIGLRLKQINAGSAARFDMVGVANTYNRIAYSDTAAAGGAYFAFRDDVAGVDRLFIDANGEIQVAGRFAYLGVLTPAQITANQNDYNPTGLSTAATLRLSTDAARSVTGLAGGSSGRRINIINVGANDLTLSNNVTSTASNRFLFGADITLNAEEGVTLLYDATSSRWRCIGRHN